MRVGMIMPRTAVDGSSMRTETLAEGARRIETCGYDGVWAFDAVNRGFTLPDPLVAVAVAATATTSVEVGTCVLQLGLRNPVETAHRVITTHLVCGDRLTLGVGAGSTRSDFEAFGASYEERFERYEHGLTTLRELCAGKAVGPVDLTPWEPTLGGPPLLIGAWGNGRWIDRAATEFDGWIGSAAKGGRLAEGAARYKAAGGRRAMATNITVDLTGPDSPLADGEPLSLVCSPNRVRERLAWLGDAGFDDVVLRTADHTEDNLSAIRELVP